MVSLIGGWITHLMQDKINTWMNTVGVTDTETNPQGNETRYVTKITYGTPFRETKYIMVDELLNYYTEAELNTDYHTADEYRNAVAKYGKIYKTQKFENADTAEKLFEYAKDWIKNNYHGSITSFDITALDLHAIGEEAQPYMCGDRIQVYYPDSGTQAMQVLTCISAEYHLDNPDQFHYTIGVPDSTLNKVYGEDKKSTTGGGGGGKKNTTNVAEDDKADAESQKSWLSSLADGWEEAKFNFFNKVLHGGQPDESAQQTRNLLKAPMLREGGVSADDEKVIDAMLPPSEEEPEDPYLKALRCDGMRAGYLKVNKADIQNIKGLNQVKATNGTINKIKIPTSMEYQGSGVGWITITLPDGTSYTVLGQ